MNLILHEYHELTNLVQKMFDCLFTFLAVHAEEVTVGNIVANRLDNGTWCWMQGWLQIVSLPVYLYLINLIPLSCRVAVSFQRPITGYCIIIAWLSWLIILITNWGSHRVIRLQWCCQPAMVYRRRKVEETPRWPDRGEGGNGWQACDEHVTVTSYDYTEFVRHLNILGHYEIIWDHMRPCKISGWLQCFCTENKLLHVYRYTCIIITLNSNLSIPNSV